MRRHLHDRQASVFALKRELDAWRERRGVSPNGQESPADSLAPPIETDTAPRAARWTPHRAAAVLFLAIGLGLGWAAGVFWRRDEAPRPGIVRFTMLPPKGTMFAGNIEDPDPTLSPDGRALVFRAAEISTGRQRLYLRPLDGEPSPLEGTDNAIQPFWSPDGTSLAFFADGWLKTLSLASGRLAALVECPSPEGGAWLDDRIVFSPAKHSPLVAIPVAGGQPVSFTTVARDTGEVRHSYPSVLPGGEVLFYVDHRDPERRSIAMVGQAGEAHTTIATSPSVMTFAPPGYLVGFRSGTLVALRFDPSGRTVENGALELGERVTSAGDPQGPSISATATSLAFWDPRGGPLAKLTWFDRQGHDRGSIGPAGFYASVALSPDGTRVAVQRLLEVGEAPDIWAFNTRSGAATRLTASPANDEDPVWAPDSTRMVYARHRDQGLPSHLHTLSLEKPLGDSPLLRSELSAHPTDWSADGRWVVYQAMDRVTDSDVWRIPADGGRPEALVRTEFSEMHGRSSPDGRHLAYSSNVSGRREVYVLSLGNGRTVSQVSTAGGAHPRWRSDGRELYYLSEQGHIVAVPVTAAPGFRPGPPVSLFEARPTLPLVFSDVIYDVTRDGQQFVVAAGGPVDARPITVVLNWQSALRP